MVTYGFYNALNHDRVYDATQMSSIFDGIINDGIFESIGTHLSVSANSGMDISIGIGRAWFNSTWTLNDSILPLTVDEAEVVLDRIDAVVLEVNSSTEVRANAIKIVKGTPSSNPVAPTMIETEEVHQHRLANITVGAGVTEITQAEIENFIGTEETPFITGILETMSVDTLVAQWQTEYRQMKDADHTAYTSSLTADHNAYVQQREADDASFDTWFAEKMEEVIAWYENLQVQIDDNVAVNLQNQIGTLSLLSTQTKTNLVAAINELVAETYPCFIRVTCAEEFAGDAVELIYGGEVIKTKLIPSSAPYVVEFGVKETGQYTLREVAYDITTTVNVSNYTIYNAGLYLGSITLAVDEDFIGTTITCTDGTTTKEWLCDGLTHVFSVGLGTWVISGTIDGETYSTTVVVTDYINYPAELRIKTAGWQEWVMAGGLSPSGYDDLDDVLADESAIRTLMTKHDAVDFLVEWAEEDLESIRKIIRNDLCAKWINLRDYALDTLYSSETIKYEMDHSAVTALVPKLTSNTGTNGVASALSENNPAWKAFDEDDTTSWWGETDLSWIQYKFNKPTLVVRVHIISSNGSFKLQGSNDGTAWVDLSNSYGSSSETSYIERYINVNEEAVDDYLYYRILPLTQHSQNAFGIRTLQFYGYGDSGERAGTEGLVPILSSNTGSNGEAFGGSSGRNAYKYFDGNTSSGYDDDSYFGYTFNEAKIVNRLMLYTRPSYNSANKHKFQASNDGTNWIDLLSEEDMSVMTAASTYYYIDIDNNTAYTHYRVFHSNTSGFEGFRECQLYNISELPTGTKYFLGEWALMPQVPKMTSNSAPYGEASASSEQNESVAYRLFDLNSTTKWSAIRGTGNNSWVQYKFIEPVKCVRVKLVGGGKNFYLRNGEYQIQGSNDGINFNNISEVIEAPTIDDVPSGIYADINTDVSYLYYRINTVKANSVYNGDEYSELFEAQFYSWGPKGAVPVMTSNSAPYGECVSSTLYQSAYAYYAFDGNEDTEFADLSSNSVHYVGYNFVNPINVKSVHLNVESTDLLYYQGIKIQGSNDGTNWIDIGTIPKNEIEESKIYHFYNDDFYKFYRVNPLIDTSKGIHVKSLQFYGRQLTVSVPKMTSNTEPWGVASTSSNLDTTKVAYKAFDKVSTNEWHSSNDNFPVDLGYEFGSEICLKQVVITNRNTSVTIDYGIKTAEIQGSNDGVTWEKIGNNINMADTKGGVFIFNFKNNVTYKKLRVHILDSYWKTGEKYVTVGELQFYGLDYSEHEERHWIYDHGVEVEEVTPYANGGTVKKGSNSITLRYGSSFVRVTSQNSIDLTDYDIERAVIPNTSNASSSYLITASTQSANSDSYNSVNGNLPNNAFLDISSINQSKFIGVQIEGSGSTELSEWWLE